jgi:hypothetical protein
VISAPGVSTHLLRPASLGQVHWAKMKSGEEVAIKIQYPIIGAIEKFSLKDICIQSQSSIVSSCPKRPKRKLRGLLWNSGLPGFFKSNLFMWLQLETILLPKFQGELSNL